jgi:hypothetical protein
LRFGEQSKRGHQVTNVIEDKMKTSIKIAALRRRIRRIEEVVIPGLLAQDFPDNRKTLAIGLMAKAVKADNEELQRLLAESNV